MVYPTGNDMWSLPDVAHPANWSKPSSIQPFTASSRANVTNPTTGITTYAEVVKGLTKDVAVEPYEKLNANEVKPSTKLKKLPVTNNAGVAERRPQLNRSAVYNCSDVEERPTQQNQLTIPYLDSGICECSLCSPFERTENRLFKHSCGLEELSKCRFFGAILRQEYRPQTPIAELVNDEIDSYWDVLLEIGVSPQPGNPEDMQTDAQLALIYLECIKTYFAMQPTKQPEPNPSRLQNDENKTATLAFMHHPQGPGIFNNEQQLPRPNWSNVQMLGPNNPTIAVNNAQFHRTFVPATVVSQQNQPYHYAAPGIQAQQTAPPQIPPFANVSTSFNGISSMPPPWAGGGMPQWAFQNINYHPTIMNATARNMYQFPNSSMIHAPSFPPQNN